MQSPPSWAFLLDEHMPKRTAAALRAQGYPALRVIDAGLQGQPDVSIFAFARANNRIIITRDVDFLRPNFKPPHPGILLLILPDVPGQAIVDPLLQMLATLQGQDLTNTVHQLTSSGIQRLT